MMIMYAAILAALVLRPISPTLPLAMQQAPIIGPQDAIGFDYLDGDFASYAILRFDVQWDGGQWTSVGIPPVYLQQSGVTTFRIVPTLPSGSHTVSLRACNVVGCGGVSAPFPFVVLDAPGVAPSNVRKIPRG